MRRWIWILALSLWGGTVMAQQSGPSWTVGVMGTATQTFYAPEGLRDMQLKPLDAQYFRLHLGYRLRPRWGLELAYSRGVSQLVFEPGVGTNSGSSYFNAVELAAHCYLLPTARFQPYLLLGVGLVDVPPNGARREGRTADPVWKPMLNAGGGADWWVADRLALSGLITLNAGSGWWDKYVQYSAGIKLRVGQTKVRKSSGRSYRQIATDHYNGFLHHHGGPKKG